GSTIVPALSPLAYFEPTKQLNGRAPHMQCPDASGYVNSDGRTTMKNAIMTLMGVATGVLMMVSGNWAHAQGTDPNVAPNRYKMQENWAQLSGRPEIRTNHQGTG